MSTSLFRTDVMDPATNIIDAYKELCLLEDHLIKPSRYCPDCIKKHLLKLEALAEECVSLSGTDKWGLPGQECQNLALAAREWRARLMQGESNRSVASSVRTLRKAIGRRIPLRARAGLTSLQDLKDWKEHPAVRWGAPIVGGILLGRWLSR